MPLGKWQDFLKNSFKEKIIYGKKPIKIENDILDSKITLTEIKESLAKTKNNKASGLDD